jgi:hypothetical protein
MHHARQRRSYPCFARPVTDLRAADRGALRRRADVLRWRPLVLRQIEQRLGIARRLAACMHDPRAPERIAHGLDAIIRFRMLMIAAGYEDGNDADTLRTDPLFKLAMDRLPEHRDLDASKNPEFWTV